MSEPAYDTIGRGYAEIRRPDPRIATRIETALGDARSVINVGAGTGSYEPPDREVTAVEPSAEMISQRPADAAPVVQASAEGLPFEDDSFDAAMAIITIHHWDDVETGLAEMARVASKRIVVLALDADRVASSWIFADYFPEGAAVDRRRMPEMTWVTRAVRGATRVEILPCPARCTDRFTLALWDRPEDLLKPEVMRAGSISHAMSPYALADGLNRLRSDLESGRWDEKYGHLRALEELDVGLRLIVSEQERGEV